MQIRQLGSREIDLYRTIRLAALATDPNAFGSSLTREQRFTDDDWAARIESFRGEPGAVFVATAAAPVGVAGVGRLAGTTSGYLWGMWVSPGVRGQGIGTRLVNEALSWSRSHSLDLVWLDVDPGNDRAVSLYETIGFVRADEQAPSPGAQLEMVLSL